jgi:phosphotransferase system HPr (HPr) family protein
VRVTLPRGVDLHARPAAVFVRTAIAFPCDLWVTAGEREADAKSLMSLLALGAKGGTSLQLRAEGPEAAAALEALARTVASFGEAP